MLGGVMVGSNAAAELAQDFERANREVIAFAQSCSDSDWNVICEAERWPVGVLVDHMADWNVQVEAAIQSYLRGQELPFTAEMVDAHNAQHATDSAAVSREEAIRRLEESSTRMVATVRSLSDADLAIAFPLPLAGGPASTTDLIKMVTEHVAIHLPSARRSLTG
jgi:DinB family protein